MTVRAGLIGTGTWARRAHLPALAAAADVELVGIWGRSAGPRDELAAQYGIRSFEDPLELAAAVDLVAFAVPPEVQASLAPAAAALGRDLLLEKPLGPTGADAESIARAVRSAGVGAVVFTTRLFDPARVAWLRRAADRGYTEGHAEFVSGALSVGAYRDSAWRQVSGALWDVGPHVVSQLEAVLGPIQAIAVDEAVPGGDVRLRFEHPGSASTAHLNLHSTEDRLVEWLRFGSDTDGTTSPPAGATYPESFGFALEELLHPSLDPILDGASVDAGVATVRILETAQSLIEAGRVGRFVLAGGAA
jgi:predicted dehydrogenase